MSLKNIIIFGIGEQAELANWYFQNDSDYTVSAFTVDKEFITESHFCNKPVVPFEEVSSLFPASNYSGFIAIGYNRLNELREQKYQSMKGMGYSLVNYISTKANIFTDHIGDNCFILEDNTIQPFVKIGNNVTLWSGNHIGHHSTISDHCFITSHVVVSGGVEIGRNSFLGVNATVRDHIKIEAYNVIGASAIIMNSTKEYELYVPDRTIPREKRSTDLKRI